MSELGGSEGATNSEVLRFSVELNMLLVHLPQGHLVFEDVTVMLQAELRETL